ncbi:MAG: hypothetical protein OEQ12_01390 [Nitrosopumilus sp.]|nr:hypothetical protein [Nitrosopumilus sp.]
MKTIVILAIALACSIGIISAVFVVGGMYQQELFEEYMDDVQDSKTPRSSSGSPLPVFDILP